MIASAPSHYCCGIVEIGNFEYTKDRGPKGGNHFHKIGGGWQTQKAAPGTSEGEIRSVVFGLTKHYGGVICSTGADQEYLDDILPRLGFVRTDFTNVVHERGTVKFWFLASDKYLPGAIETPKAPAVTVKGLG